MSTPQDPAVNYTAPPNQSFGAKIPEYALRHLLDYNLQLVAEDVAAHPTDGMLDEHFGTLMAKDREGIKDFFRVKDERGKRRNIPVTTNFPHPGAQLPLVCVVNRGEVPNDAAQFLGRYAGVRRTGVASGERVKVANVYTVGERRNVEIYVGTPDPDLTMFLHFFLKRVVYANSNQLEEAFDVHALTVSGRDVSVDTNTMPPGYYKNLFLQFDTYFDWEGAEGSETRLGTVGLLVDALKEGVPTLTPVPGTD